MSCDHVLANEWVRCSRKNASYITICSAIHKRNTRESNNVVVSRCRLSVGQRAFYFGRPRERNGPADNIKNLKKLIVLSGYFSITCFMRNNYADAKQSAFKIRSNLLFFSFMVVANCNASCYWLHVHCRQW